MKTRLDIACVERKLFESRKKAQGSIMAGLVKINGVIADKAGRPVKDEDTIEIIKPLCPYVSRGGLKLKGALDEFNIKVKDKICADIGVATGGFSDCFLQEGAKLVHGVDVGEGQIHEKIKDNPSFNFIPQTNARFLTPEHFNVLPEVIAIDISFISLKLILGPVFNSSAKHSDIIALIKPQFELEKRDLKHGIVKSEEIRFKAVELMRDFIKENYPAIKEMGLVDSSIKGAKGNLEFLLHLRKGYE
ncbi:MAG: TlyA family RNA methyltransferase [Elusimicrobia bacterium]|nr:TlyA family RNA methyltransferase [Elusimicrobiota bacterium]